MNMTYNTSGLKDINTEIKRLQRKLSDLQWDGDWHGAMQVSFRITHLEKLREQGDVYDTEF